MTSDSDLALLEVLSESRRRGLIGPAAPADQLEHSRGFSDLLAGNSRLGHFVLGPSVPPVTDAGERMTVLDLGSGGGVPGLVLAVDLPHAGLILLESAARRCRFLEWAVKQLDIADRVRVIHNGAEDAARSPLLRESADVVTARSFGPPAVTAECARGFLVDGGHLIVSEPPLDSTPDGMSIPLRSSPDGNGAGRKSAASTGSTRRSVVSGTSERWPSAPLAVLGFGDPNVVRVRGGTYAVMEALDDPPPDVPRKRGISRKRPLF